MEYKYELHSHAKNTSICSMIDAEKLVQKYKKAGYSGIVITDHYSPMTFRPHELFNKEKLTRRFIRGYNKAKEFETEDFTVLFGIELRFYGTVNDYLIYGAEPEMLDELPGLLSVYVRKASALFRERGCLFIHAHPYRRHIGHVDPSLLDGVEVYNGKASDEINQKAKDYADKIGFSVVTSGSDCHKDSQVGLGGIITNEPIRSNKDLVRILKSGNYKLIENSSAD